MRTPTVCTEQATHGRIVSKILNPLGALHTFVSLTPQCTVPTPFDCPSSSARLFAARTSLAGTTISLCDPLQCFTLQIRNPHLNSQREHLLLGTTIEAGLGSQSAFRNDPHAHQTLDYRRLSGFIGFRFS